MIAGEAAVATAAILMFQAVASELSLVASPYVASLRVPSFLLELIRAFPLSCVVANGTIQFQGSGSPFELYLSLSQLVPLAAFQVFVGGSALLLLAPPRDIGRNILFLGASLVVYCVLRLLILVGLYQEFRAAWLLVDPNWTLVSMGPFVLFLAAEIPVRKDLWLRSLSQFYRFRSKKDLYIVSSLWILLFGLWALFRFGEPAVEKAGRVLVDEGHSNWAWTDHTFGELSFGLGTEYHYGAFFRRLQERFDVRRNYGTISTSVLNNADVLIIKIPSRPFTTAERDAVCSFVNRGGGLLLIGDHTDVFGSSTIMNELCRSLSCRFNLDGVFDLKDQGCVVWLRQGQLWHQILESVPKVCFATSCSIKLSPGSLNIISRGNVYSDAANYGHYSFFGDLAYSSADPVATQCLVAVAPKGEGRVAWFTDSTILSNFAIHNPCNLELSLALVNWLNKVPRWHCFPWLARSGLGLALVLMILAVVRGRFSIGHLVVALALSVLGAIVVLHAVRTPPELPPRSGTPRAYFDTKHCRFELDQRYFFMDVKSEKEFSTDQSFYTLTQRLGIVPRVMDNLAEPSPQDMVVFFEPVRRFSCTDRRHLERFLNLGGCIMVLDASFNQASTANQLLADYKMEFRDQGVGRDTSFVEYDGTSVKLSHVRTILGGTPVLEDSAGRTVVASRQVGKGRVIAMGDCSAFADSSLGLLGSFPKPDQLARIKLEFFLLRLGLSGHDANFSSKPSGSSEY